MSWQTPRERSRGATSVDCLAWPPTGVEIANLPLIVKVGNRKIRGHVEIVWMFSRNRRSQIGSRFGSSRWLTACLTVEERCPICAGEVRRHEGSLMPSRAGEVRSTELSCARRFSGHQIADTHFAMAIALPVAPGFFPLAPLFSVAAAPEVPQEAGTTGCGPVWAGRG
jgi:hypothetical protein